MSNPEPAASDNRPTNVRYFMLAWACSLSMLTYIDRVCIKNFRGDMQTDLGIDDEQFGWVFSAFGLAYAIFEVPSGWFGDRLGPRLVLCRIVIWWSLFTVLTGCVWNFSHDLGPFVVNSLGLLVCIRFLFGMGEAGAYPNAARALRNWFPYARRGRSQGWLWAFGRWGGAASPLIALAALPFGWRGAFFIFGLVGAVWVVFFHFYFRNTPAEHPGVNQAEIAYVCEKGDERAKLPLSWRMMFSSPSFWLLCGMYFFSNAGWCFFITWDMKYYTKILHLNDSELMIAAGAPLFCGGFACVTGGLLTDRQVRIWGPRWGRTLQGFCSYFVGACCFLLALAVDSPFLSVAFLCGASFCKDFAMAVNWSTCLDMGHRYSGTIGGFMNGIGNLGTFVAPTVVARLAKDGQWDRALVFSACMFIMACSCWLFINPRRVIVYSAEDRETLRAQGILE